MPQPIERSLAWRDAVGTNPPIGLSCTPLPKPTAQDGGTGGFLYATQAMIYSGESYSSWRAAMDKAASEVLLTGEPVQVFQKCGAEWKPYASLWLDGTVQERFF